MYFLLIFIRFNYKNVNILNIKIIFFYNKNVINDKISMLSVKQIDFRCYIVVFHKAFKSVLCFSYITLNKTKKMKKF